MESILDSEKLVSSNCDCSSSLGSSMFALLKILSEFLVCWLHIYAAIFQPIPEHRFSWMAYIKHLLDVKNVKLQQNIWTCYHYFQLTVTLFNISCWSLISFFFNSCLSLLVATLARLLRETVEFPLIISGMSHSSSSREVNSRTFHM